VAKVDFAAEPAVQQALFLEVLAGTKDLQGHFDGLDASGSKKRGRKVKGDGTAKAERDPNAPKRPSGAYLVWMQNHRAELEREFPDKLYKELMAEAGTRWKALTDGQRAVREPFCFCFFLPGF
jgi:hypothetical protein